MTSRRLLPTPAARDWKGQGYEGQLPNALSQLTSSPAASPAEASAPQEGGRALAIPRLSFGESRPGLSGSFDLDTFWSKTSQPSLLSTEETASPKSSVTFPRAGTMHGGTCSPQQPLAPRTGGNGYSLLPTPRTSDQNGPGQHGQGGPDLRTAAQMLPTPKRSNNENRQTEGQYGPNLGMALGVPMALPSSDGKQSSAGQRLSPWFVEWMMGAPRGFTDPDCPLSATEFRCKWGNSWDE